MKHIPLILLAATLAGCAVGPKYVAPTGPEVQLSSLEAKAFDPAAVQAQASWWLFFEEPDLNRLIETALAQNRDLRQAQARLLAARAVFDERQLERLPAITSAASYQRALSQQASSDGTPERTLSEHYRVGFDTQWEIDLFGRLQHLSQSARARADATQAEFTLLQLSIAAEVARVYYQAQGLQQQLDLAQQQQRSWAETVKVTAASVRLGSGLPEDLANARAQLLRAEASIPSVYTRLQQAQYRLDVLTGQAPGQPRVLAAPQAAPLAKNLPLGDVNELIRQRPDVVKAERLLAASSADVGAATADLFPRLNLGGFLGFIALRGGDIGHASRGFELTPNVTWPALQLGNARARLRGAKAQNSGALAQYEQAVLLAQEEVEGAVTQLVQHQDSLKALWQSAQHAQQALTIATKRHRAGSGAYLNVLANQRAVYEIKQALLQAQTDSYINVVALYKALGWGQA
ncbi:MAG: TolC family protein [Neisseriaceae bacterium]|nr:TolC family protein [Neisseriaceae bacterium]MBP6861621.1 TolC family protein [Neisseriaceae bacterium]